MKKTLRIKNVVSKTLRFTLMQIALMALFETLSYAHENSCSDVLNQLITFKGQTVDIKSVTNIIHEEISFVDTEKALDVVPTAAHSISGIVTDENNEPLVGANVVLQGTTKGTLTDTDGKFSLEIEDSEKNGILVISFVGYDKLNVAIEGRSVINVIMKESGVLNEIVVVGYGTQRKADLTGSVAAVDVQQMLSKPAADLTNMLQGRVSGVVASGSNQPGGNGYVRIRGISSFGSNEPLVIIDGVQTNGTNSLNPNDIESINVLKDASSAAIYGARGAGGVIIITTKKGKANKTRITYDGFYGVAQVTRYPNMVNTSQLGELLWKQQLGAGIVPTSPQYGKGASPVIPDYILAGSSGGLFEGNPAVDPSKYVYDQTGFYQIVKANKEGTDWFKEMTQAAPTQSHNITASGGTDKGVYSLSMGYYNEAGLQKYTFYDRYSIRANSEFKLGKRIRFGETMFGSFRKRKGSGDNDEGAPWSQAYRMQSIVPVYDIMGNFAGSKAPGTGNGQNPVAILFRAKDNTEKDIRLLGNVYAELDILPGLRYRSSYGIDFNNNNSKSFRSVNPEHSEGNFQTSYSITSGYQYRTTFSNTLHYDKEFGKHGLKLLAGTEAVEYQREQVGGDRSGYYPFTDQSFWVLDRGNPVGQNNSSSFNDEALYSVFGRADYSFAGKYLLNATLRRDGSSKFAKANRYGNFPSVSAGWRISEENFMKNVTIINNLKIRGGYGVVGNDQIDGNNQYSFYRSDPGRSFYDISGTNTSTVAGYDLDRKGNPNSKWEETSTLNLGFDLSMMSNRFEMNFDIYDKKTTDLLVQLPRPGTEGDFIAPFVNIGSSQNKGIDMMLTFRSKQGSTLQYAASANFTAYKNQVLSSGVDFFTNSTRNSPVSRTLTGNAIGMFYGYVLDGFFNSVEEVMTAADQPGVNKTSTTTAQQSVGRWRLKDINGDGKVTADDRMFLGSPHPKFQTGMNFDVAYKNFDFNLFVFWNYGNQIYNNTKWWTDMNGFTGNRSVKMLQESWTPENKNASLPKLDANDNISNARPHTYFVESGSYLRAKTLQFGYTMPQNIIKRIGASNLRIYVQGQNLFTITKYSGPDPDLLDVGRGDIGLGVDHGRVPNPLQILGGVSITF